MSARTRALGALALAGCLALPLGSAAAEPTATYTNPVSSSFADTFADPSIIHAKDGWWYAYATADPLRAGQAPKDGHIARTRDFQNWEYVGSIFNDTNRPAWATSTAGLWAPDVRYIQGRYVMYFTVTDTTLNPGVDNAIGVATAPTPAGPWVPTAAPVVKNLPGETYWKIDPAGFTDTDGNQYLYWGSYYGGVHVSRVSPDGVTLVGDEKQVAHWDRYEGSYVTEHDGWYYLMGSSANCCAGPTTGYSVFAGRSRSPMGPFLDKDGFDLNASVTGGTTVVTQNGNRWIGAGHNAMTTDAEGRDFLVYHAIDRNQPWLDQPYGINRRPMLIDRLDWIDGWPRVRAGQGPSDTPQPAPVTSSLLGITPWDPAAALTRSQAVADPQGGTSARVNGVARTVQSAPAGDLRVRLDVKTDAPFTVKLGQGPDQVVVTLADGTLTATAAGHSGSDTVVPMTGWRTLVVERNGGRLDVELSAEDLADPAAVVRLDGLTRPLSSAPVTFNGNGLVDNLFVARPAVEATQLAPVPQPDTALFRDDFTTSVDPSWTWVRPQSDVTVSGGQLVWPLKSVDLSGTQNTGALLLHDAPAGDWIAETRFTLPLGQDSNDRNYQQAGMVVRNTDDDFARLGKVSIWGTRTVEYGREMPEAGRLSYGGAIIGTPSDTMSMRIAHHVNAKGENLYRAGISRDGVTWTWGATWVLAAGTNPQIGLYAGGGATPAVSARFDWFQISSATAGDGAWPNS